MNGEDAVKEIAKATGGEIKEMGRLPDGSGFAVVSMPLPKDHWIYRDNEQFHTPPMPFRMGSKETFVCWVRPGFRIKALNKEEMADRIRMATKYAIRASTMSGKDMDFDPDAMVQNMINGMLGYWTKDGLSSEEFANPTPRTQWCCEGTNGEHEKRCRNNPGRENMTTGNEN